MGLKGGKMGSLKGLDGLLLVSPSCRAIVDLFIFIILAVGCLEKTTVSFLLKYLGLRILVE